MRIGLLSDTHGSIGRTRLAAQALLNHGVDVVFHCGDIGAELVLVELIDVFHESGIHVHAVLGNVDTYDDALANFPESTGVSVEGLSYAVHVGGKPSVLIHGHVRREFDQAVESGNNAYVFTGHTHVPEDRSVGPTRIINPGAVYRASEPSVAVLDDISGQVTWIPLL